MSRLRTAAPTGLACLFTVTGVLHFVRPVFFEPIVPRLLPTRLRRPVVFASGLAELACAVGLVRRRRWASGVSTAVLLAVWPANLQMALDAGSGRHAGPMDSPAVAWGRMPLQLPMLWAARQARRDGVTDR